MGSGRARTAGAVVIPLDNSVRATIRDVEGATVGAELARGDQEECRPAASDADILAYLSRVASGTVTNWAQDECLRAYRRAWARAVRP